MKNEMAKVETAMNAAFSNYKHRTARIFHLENRMIKLGGELNANKCELDQIIRISNNHLDI